MRLQPNEIASILREQIEKYEVPTGVEEVGTIIQLSDGIARVYGLESCVALEMIEFPHGVTGLALNLEEDNVAVVLFGHWQLLKEGDTAKRTGKVMSVPVGEGLIGRVVDPLGNAARRRSADRGRQVRCRWSSRRPASSTASRSPSRCRPASRRSTG